MSELSKYLWRLTEDAKRDSDYAAALLGLSDGGYAIGKGLKIVLAHAKACVHGYTEIAFCTPNVAALIESNPEFIAALCEEGVVEWLTPFVLAKPKQSNHPAPDTTQS
jgi:hypothetical protein